MGRDINPACKKCRRERQKLFLKGPRCETDKCAIERRPYPPGEHGRGRIKETEYLLQLREKQKAKRIYGVLEKQFRNYYSLAARQKGITGENLLRLLESRMDNVIYRGGMAASRKQGRQVVRHGHVTLNGKKASIPSMRVKEGDVIEIKAASKESAVILNAVKLAEGRHLVNWLKVDPEARRITVATLPTREEIDIPVKESLIVELYSK